MRFPGFIGPSYTLSSVNYECQRSINLYPEMNELGQTGKEHEVATLIGTPGLSLLCTLSTGPVRALWYTSTGLLYAVAGNQLFSISSSYVATSVGTLQTVSGPVSIADNGIQLVVVDGANGYYITIPTTTVPVGAYVFTITSGNTASVGTTFTNNGQTFTVVNQLTSSATSLVASGTGAPQTSGSLALGAGPGTGPIFYSSFSSPPNTISLITDANWLGSNQVSFQDGYFIFAKPNSTAFYLSDLNAVTFGAPALTQKNGFTDNIVSQLCSNRNLWLLGDQTSEVWFDSGNNLNPFQYVQGSLSHIGCAASLSSVKMANTIFWLGKDQTGSGVVYMANGYTPQRISTQAVELAIQSYSTMSDAIAYAYQENGHQFYVLTFPTGNATWVYDLASSLWHERAYSNQGIFGRHLSNCYAFAFNTHVVGDYSNGNIYNMSSSFYSDNGNPLIRQRITPHLSKDMNRVFVSSIQLDFETNIGLSSGQGSQPLAMLSWSNDGGHSWSNEHTAHLCAIGNNSDRAIWRRLGQSRNRVFKFSISDPVKVVLIGAEIDLMAGAS